MFALTQMLKELLTNCWRFYCENTNASEIVDSQYRHWLHWYQHLHRNLLIPNRTADLKPSTHKEQATRCVVEEHNNK